MRVLLRILGLFLAFQLFATAPALAGPAVLTLTDPALGGAGGNTHGFSFTPTATITVTHLGVYDDEGDGLVHSHEVAIWKDADQSLIRSGTVASGTAATLISGFRYVDVADFVLEAGTSYVIGAYYPSHGAGPFDAIANADAFTTVTTDPLIDITDGRFNLTFGQLAFVDRSDTVERFGPNFLILETVPEPMSAAVFGIGLAGVWLARRRRV